MGATWKSECIQGGGVILPPLRTPRTLLVSVADPPQPLIGTCTHYPNMLTYTYCIPAIRAPLPFHDFESQLHSPRQVTTRPQAPISTEAHSASSITPDPAGAFRNPAAVAPLQ